MLYLASPRVIPIPSSPKTGSSLLASLVNLKVFIPFVNLRGGGGELVGSLKKNEPNTAPNSSGINLLFVNVAIAPLVSPINLMLFIILPENWPWASSVREAISIFNTTDDSV